MREPFQGGWNECPVCRKRFRVDQPGEWLYCRNKRKAKNRYTRTYYCSWKCFRQTKKEKGAEKDGEKG